MHFGVTIAVMGLVAGMVMMPFGTSRATLLADDDQITEAGLRKIPGAQQANASQAAASTVPQTVSTTAGDRTPAFNPTMKTASVNTTATPSGGPVVSTAMVVPQSMNTSTVSNISTGTSVPLPVTASKVTNASSSILTSQSMNPQKNLNFSTNAPELKKVSTLTTVPQQPGRDTNYPQAMRVPQGMRTQQAACPHGGKTIQQNPASDEAMAELIKGLDKLSGIYTMFPSKFGFLNDAKEEAPQDDPTASQNPLQKFRMCTLITRIGDERGPITILVTAEDEQRMRASGSYYHVGDVFPEKQRAFTSFCPGREDLYLTFNPNKR